MASVESAPSAPEAVDRALEAAQRLVVERLELARIDIQQSLAGVLRTAAVSGVLALVGWVALTAALVIVLEAYLTRAGALALVGTLQIAAAALVGRTGRVPSSQKERGDHAARQ